MIFINKIFIFIKDITLYFDDSIKIIFKTNYNLTINAYDYLKIILKQLIKILII